MRKPTLDELRRVDIASGGARGGTIIAVAFPESSSAPPRGYRFSTGERARRWALEQNLQAISTNGKELASMAPGSLQAIFVYDESGPDDQIIEAYLR